jgi:hypothetical protein
MFPEERTDRFSPTIVATMVTARPANPIHAGKVNADESHVPAGTTFWEYCDNCGTQLQRFRCRLVCPKCGFFHSCSEP